MVRLIDDLLDVSRISRNKLDIRKERVELTAVVESAVESNRPLIQQFGHELTVSLPPQPVQLDADAIRLTQVFLNLLNNAAKYTKRGGHIWLTADREGSDAVVSVRDNGIGISAESLAELFTPFSQVDSGLARKFEGTGLGLALVSAVARAHGGDVLAQSTPGQGSEFELLLPAPAGPLELMPGPAAGTPGEASSANGRLARKP